jgi:hypothetical protein
MPDNQPSPIHFSESFRLTDKSGVVHVFTFAGTLEQKPEIVRTCAQSIRDALSKGWKVDHHGAAATSASDPNTTTETIMAEQLIVSADEKGKHFKIKGGEFKQHGLAVYEEYLEALGISPGLEPGAHPFKKKVVVQTTANTDGKKSSKVVALG